MSTFFDGARQNYNPMDDNKKWSEHLSQEFPALTQVLCGSDETVPKAERLPAMTLMIFAKDGTLRFSLSNRDWPRSFFGSVTNPLDVLKSVEEAIMTGKGDWVNKREQGR